MSGHSAKIEVTPGERDGDAIMKIEGDTKTYRRWGFIKSSLYLDVSNLKVTRSFEVDIAGGSESAYITGKGALDRQRVGIAGNPMRPVREMGVTLQRLRPTPETAEHHWRASASINMPDGEFILDVDPWVQGYVPAEAFDTLALAIRRGEATVLTAIFELSVWSENLPDHYYFGPGRDGSLDRPEMATGRLTTLRWFEAKASADAPKLDEEVDVQAPPVQPVASGQKELAAALSKLYPLVLVVAVALTATAVATVFR